MTRAINGIVHLKHSTECGIEIAYKFETCNMAFGHKQMTDQILCTEPDTIAKQNFNPLELINNNMFGPSDSAYVCT